MNHKEEKTILTNGFVSAILKQVTSNYISKRNSEEIETKRSFYETAITHYTNLNQPKKIKQLQKEFKNFCNVLRRETTTLCKYLETDLYKMEQNEVTERATRLLEKRLGDIVEFMTSGGIPEKYSIEQSSICTLFTTEDYADYYQITTKEVEKLIKTNQLTMVDKFNSKISKIEKFILIEISK